MSTPGTLMEPWTPAEDEALVKYVERYPNDWRMLRRVRALKNRSLNACTNRIRKLRQPAVVIGEQPAEPAWPPYGAWVNGEFVPAEGTRRLFEDDPRVRRDVAFVRMPSPDPLRSLTGNSLR